MKKTLSLLILLGLAAFLSACGNDSASEDPEESNLPSTPTTSTIDPVDPVDPVDETETPENDVSEELPADNEGNSSYTNTDFAYSVSYPEAWDYKETGGEYFAQATGFNPADASDEDYQVIVAVLNVDKQDYLDSMTANSNLKLNREYSDYFVDNKDLTVSKFVYENVTTGDTFAIYTIQSNLLNERTYVITGDEAVIEETFLNSFSDLEGN